MVASLADILTRLARLHSDGRLTDEEFDVQKEAFLASSKYGLLSQRDLEAAATELTELEQLAALVGTKVITDEEFNDQKQRFLSTQDGRGAELTYAEAWTQPGAEDLLRASPHGSIDCCIDERSGLVLPVGVVLAGTGRRIGAYFLSLILVIVTLGLGYVIWGLVIWDRGQTPTYQVLKMRAWRPETGEIAGFWWMALREIVGRFAEALLGLITLLVSFILMMARPDRKTLHDLIAGTVVVHDPSDLLAPLSAYRGDMH